MIDSRQRLDNEHLIDELKERLFEYSLNDLGSELDDLLPGKNRLRYRNHATHHHIFTYDVCVAH